MVIYDWPRDRPMLYQLFLAVAIWAWYASFLKISNSVEPTAFHA